MPSETDICNLALLHIGARVIANLDEASEEARKCKTLYYHQRDHVLESHPWGFAGKYVTLALVSGGDPQGFEYAYQIPSDCLSVREIYQESYTTGPIDFVVVGSEIWTNQEDAVLFYTMKMTDTGVFSALFVTTLSYKLASELVMPLRVDTNLRKEMLAAYIGWLSYAATQDARQEHDTREKTDDFLAARS